MHDTMFYVVLDAYPELGSESFAKYCGAAIGCWVLPEACAGGLRIDEVLKEHLWEEGWSVARVLARDKVSSATYASKPEARAFFEQARIDGVVLQVHARTRDSVGREEPDEHRVISTLMSLPDEIVRATSIVERLMAMAGEGATADEVTRLLASDGTALRDLM